MGEMAHKQDWTWSRNCLVQELFSHCIGLKSRRTIIIWRTMMDNLTPNPDSSCVTMNRPVHCVCMFTNNTCYLIYNQWKSTLENRQGYKDSRPVDDVLISA